MTGQVPKRLGQILEDVTAVNCFGFRAIEENPVDARMRVKKRAEIVGPNAAFHNIGIQAGGS